MVSVENQNVANAINAEENPIKTNNMNSSSNKIVSFSFSLNKIILNN